MNLPKSVCPVKSTRQYMTYFSSFIVNPWLDELKAVCQGQSSFCATHPRMLVIIYVNYGTNPFRTILLLKSGHGKMCHSFVAFLRLHGWLTMKININGTILLQVIICAKYGKHPSITVRAVEWTEHDVPYFSSCTAKFMTEWPWRLRSRSKIFECDTTFHASNRLC